jgi:hypothetical protein
MTTTKPIHDVSGEARSMERFEFIALFVSRCTARIAGREVTGGLLVRKTRAGWVYGFKGMADLCAPGSAARVVDAIRRTRLNHYVQMAEDFRIEAHREVA